MKNLVVITLLFSILLLALPISASAAGLVPCGGQGEPQCTFRHLVSLLVSLINYLFSIASVVAILMVLWAGFRLIAASGSTEQIKSAKQGLTNAVVGFLMIAFAFVLVNFIVGGLFGREGAEKRWWEVDCVYQPTTAGCPFSGLIEESAED